MNKTITCNGLKITVRPRTGLDSLDAPIIRRILADHITGVESVSIKQVSERDWNRLNVFTRFLQQSTLEGDGLHLPSTDSSAEMIGMAYDVWLVFIAEYGATYDLWSAALDEVDRAIPDPQPKSAAQKSTPE